MLGIQYRIVCY
uniref:Uncharacterized protein n=1 Tax=Anopheles quadriannulatus TaxID=34691 RepID=A0A182XRX9_ANOQN